MHKTIITCLVLIFCTCAGAQKGKVFDSLIIKSELLKKNKKFALYLPPGYDSSVRNYPVLYLLHGGGDDQKGWLQFGEVDRIADKAIREGKASPMIIVMPDAERTFYMNSVNGQYPFEDFFIKELIPYIEQHYRCRKGKQYRAVAGLSMGGFGSLLYSMHHPDLFATCAAMSAAVRTDDQINEMPLNEFLLRYRTVVGEIKEGEQRITPFWKNNSILHLVAQIPAAQKAAVRFYLDIGDDDFLYKGNSLLHIAMRDLEIPHEYRVRNGMHNWDYWRTGLPDVLEFISESFRL